VFPLPSAGSTRSAIWFTRGVLQIGYRQTKPHIGWMLFENDAQIIDV